MWFLIHGEWHVSFPTINVNVAELPGHDAAMARVRAMAKPEMNLVGDNISNEVGVSVDFEFRAGGRQAGSILPPAIPIRFRSSQRRGY